MPKVLCFDCGYSFEVEYNITNPTKKCPKCLDKAQDSMLDAIVGKGVQGWALHILSGLVLII